MAHFNFTVDTVPMAESIGVVSHGVNGVSVAVSEMEAAVIAAEMAATEHICDNLDNGFFLLIRSQISQKAAHLQSAATAKLMTLRQLAIALEGIERQMERDYHMISSRYKKLFRSLDNSLQQRVFELDKVPSDMASKQYPALITRMRNDGSGFLIKQEEIVPLGQFATSAKFKLDADNLIVSIRDSLKEQAIVNAKLRYSLREDRINSPVKVSIPVIIAEADGLGGLGKTTSIHTPSLEGNLAGAEPKIQQTISGSVNQWEWKDCSPEEKSKVTSELENLCAKEALSPRVQEELMRLAKAAIWQQPAEKGI